MKQGIDLYAAYDNRIMKGMEYLSKYNLGYNVPFKTWTDKTGRYNNWITLGESSRGEFRSVFELAYNHYVYRRHLQMPYTDKVLGLIRPEWQGFKCDNPGFGTLLFIWARVLRRLCLEKSTSFRCKHGKVGKLLL